MRLSSRLLRRTLGHTDERAKAESELLGAMDVVKCATWEVSQHSVGERGGGGWSAVWSVCATWSVGLFIFEGSTRVLSHCCWASPKIVVGLCLAGACVRVLMIHDGAPCRAYAARSRPAWDQGCTPTPARSTSKFATVLRAILASQHMHSAIWPSWQQQQSGQGWQHVRLHVSAQHLPASEAGASRIHSKQACEQVCPRTAGCIVSDRAMLLERGPC